MAKTGLEILAETLIPASKLPPMPAKAAIALAKRDVSSRDWLTRLGRKPKGT